MSSESFSVYINVDASSSKPFIVNDGYPGSGNYNSFETLVEATHHIYKIVSNKLRSKLALSIKEQELYRTV